MYKCKQHVVLYLYSKLHIRWLQLSPLISKPLIRNWCSFPNLYQGTSSRYIYKKLWLLGIDFHGPDEFCISGFNYNSPLLLCDGWLCCVAAAIVTTWVTVCSITWPSLCSPALVHPDRRTHTHTMVSTLYYLHWHFTVESWDNYYHKFITLSMNFCNCFICSMLWVDYFNLYWQKSILTT